MELNIKPNPQTGGNYCIFENNGKFYYADKSYCFLVGWETMIFASDKDGKVSDWNELYCDRTGQSLEDCVEEFVSQLNWNKKENT